MAERTTTATTATKAPRLRQLYDPPTRVRVVTTGVNSKSNQPETLTVDNVASMVYADKGIQLDVPNENVVFIRWDTIKFFSTEKMDG